MAKILVVYHSLGGNTAKMAEAVAEGARGVAGTEAVVKTGLDAGVDDLLACAGVALGSPDYFSYMAGHMKVFFDEALSHKATLKGRPYVAFGTHGGGAKVLDSMERLSQAIGLSQVRPGMMCQGSPGAEEADAHCVPGRSRAYGLLGRSRC